MRQSHFFLILTAASILISVPGLAVATSTDDLTYDAPFVEGSTYNESIPHPDSVLGYPIGTQPATCAEIRAYFEALAENSERVRFHTYGETHEGRELIYLVISSPENMAKIESIQEQIGKLSDVRKLANDAEALEIIETTPAIAWLGYSIHGDELSPADSALWVAYQLAAGEDDATQKILKETVVCIDPMQNPDGRERYLAQMRMFKGKVPNPDVQTAQHSGMWPWGRGNHYFFDLNRDLFILAQPESRARVKAYRQWNPQLFVDSHEMGSMDTYLFSPPREPLNPNFSPAKHKWDPIFAEDQGQAFDRYGWSYYTREWLENWYPGYTDWVTYRGAIHILYEQSQVDGSVVRKRSGKIMTYRESVHHNVISSLANVTTLATRRKGILTDFHEEAKRCVQPLGDQEIHAYIIEPATNTTRERELIDNFLWQGIDVYQSNRAFQAERLQTPYGEVIEKRDLPSGTWIVPTNQPSKNLVNAILEFDPRMKDEFLREERFYLEKKNQSRIYDVSSWSMLIACGVTCYQTTRTVEVPQTLVERVEIPPGEAPKSDAKYGYVFTGSDDASTHAVVRLLEKGCTVRVSDEPFRAGGRSFPRGSFLLRQAENTDELSEQLREVAEEAGTAFYPANTALDLEGVDLGGRHFDLLAAPRVGLFYNQSCGTTSFGATWNLLDNEYRARVTSIDSSGVSSGRSDLRLYNVLILPSGAGRAIDEDGVGKLKQWVRNGGTLIALGSSVSLLTAEKAGMSAVRERADVLDKLDVYAEAVEREEDALVATASQADVWDYRPEEIDNATETEKPDKPAKEDEEKLKRQDSWERRFAPAGAFLRTTVDPYHWLAYGIGNPLAVMAGSSRSYYSKPPIQTPVRFVDEADIRVSGLVWPEARKRFAKTAYVTREGMGKGQIMLFPFEPQSRGYYPETSRLLWNAVFLGPGLGASAPIEW